ncbi:hypothetical protein FGRMN_7711 [Fusarium graminum]|nr:hypothetical protein FGRMN_7711 [Fusarium graminum]
MASRLKNAIKKRASRLFHRDKDGTAQDALSRTSQSRHRKSLSALSRSSKTDPHHGSEVPQTQAHSSTADQHADNLRAHPAVQPLETDLTPRTPGLERPRPTFVSGDGVGSYDDGSATGNEGLDVTSHLPSQQHEAAQENLQPATSQSKRSSHSADVEDLEGRMSRMTVFHTPNELPDIDPLTPFELVDGVPPDQAKPSRLAIDQNGPEHASTHIKPVSQESDVNLESNVSQEANINHNLEAIHPRDAEFERINQEVRANTNGESSFHLENSLHFDRTVHNQEPVVEEHIRPHVHTIYEPKRTLSIHHHEHRTLIQPIKDPNPTILPDQHWLQDDKTGEIYRIPAELGKKLM